MGEKQFDVLVAGELNIDLILDQLEVFPMLGKEILADQITVTLGSSSAIFASNLSTLGATVGFCGRIGRDSFGDKILHDLAQKKVDTRYIVRSTTADTGVTVALNFNQERAMITYPGAMKELTATDISDAMLREAKHLHVSSIFLQPGLRPDIAKLFKRAKELGLTTSLDPQWDPAEKWECNWEALLRYTDVFLPNMEELKNITRKHSVLEAVNVIKPN
jgi:sugar/nucleoside kinase (ribokinase family)